MRVDFLSMLKNAGCLPWLAHRFMFYDLLNRFPSSRLGFGLTVLRSARVLV